MGQAKRATTTSATHNRWQRLFESLVDESTTWPLVWGKMVRYKTGGDRRYAKCEMRPERKVRTVYFFFHAEKHATLEFLECIRPIICVILETLTYHIEHLHHVLRLETGGVRSSSLEPRDEHHKHLAK
jgi:hypothetical protein